jgi:hypothetical protein
MTRRRLLLLVGPAALALVVPAWAAAPPTLAGTVGPGFTISLKKGGQRITTPLRRGTYTIAVNDRSDFHNFRVRGAGVNRRITTVAFVGRKSVTLRLPAGRYTFLCDPHPVEMRGTFRVA